MYSNTAGIYNLANGYQALEDNTTGDFNVAVGPSALVHNTIGNRNVGAGYNALSANTTGSNNVGIGQRALTSNTTSVSPNTWSRARSGFNSFSPFVVRDRVALLPVDLLLFEAKRKDKNDVQLTWVTNSEINCQGFDIERMLDNETDFVKIGWVDGQGTTINSTYYEELDDNNFEGISYYRLKQMNLDGTYSYSEIKAVEGIQAESIIRIFPNPTSDILNIDLTSKATYVKIKIYDSKGALVLDAQQEINNNDLIQIHHLDRWADGVYLLRLTTDSNQVYIRKFVKE